MEGFSSQSLATESFSYSWLVNQTPQLDGLQEYLTSTSSPRDTNFNFDTSISRSSSFNIVHADEIFSNGHIMPFYFDTTKIHVEILNTPPSLPNPVPISSSDREDRVVKFYYFFKTWRKSSRRIIRRCLRILRPLCYKVGCSRKSVRVDDIETMSKKTEYRRLKKATSWGNKAQESVPISPYCCNSVCFDNESSIYEAVLHCKRSIGKKLKGFSGTKRESGKGKFKRIKS